MTRFTFCIKRKEKGSSHRRSLNLDLVSLNPEIEKTLRRRHRQFVEMGDNMNARENE
jgi:hypothetical protein